MSLLNPFFLIGAITLAIPVLIHLVRREKSEIVPFSSLMFLLKVPKRAIRQQKLKNLLLMALRLLILALLVTAFARPYLTQPATPEASTGDQRGVVMLLDNSYSMRYGSNFDRMKAEAVQRIDALGDGDRMSLVSFNDSPTVMMQATSDKNQLKGAVAALQPSFFGTRFFDAFAIADRLLTEVGGNQKQVVMISDFQRVGWNRSSRESVLANDVKVEMVSVGVEQPINVGIDSVSLDHTTFNRIYSGRVIARINNHRKDQPVSVPVSLSINDRELTRRTVNVPANGTALAEFSGFDLPLEFSKGRVRIEADDPLAIDNEFLFTLERRDKLNVLLMDAGRPRQSLYLQQAFTSSSEELPYQVETQQAQNVSVDGLSKYNVIVVNDVPRLTDRVRERMDELRKAGQGQLVILGPQADLGWWTSVDSLPVKPLQKIIVNKDRGKASFSLTSYDRNHAIFKPFQTSMRFSLNTAQFFAYTEVEVKEGGAVLAKFEDGSAALAESSGDNRGLMVFTSAVDNPLGWNDLVLKPSFLPFFHEIIRYLSRYNEVKGWYSLGDGVPVVGTMETTTAAVVSPDNERQTIGDLAPGEQRFFTPVMPGFHELRVGRELRLIAVNPPTNEGNLETMPPEDLLASVQSTAGEAQQSPLFAEDEGDQYARNQTGWWYLLLIALLAGIMEIYIANRSQRVQTGTVKV